MNQKPIFIAISTQKGGVGKSTFTTLLASQLSYQKGYNVAVIDCDYPQCSVNELRKRELAQISNNLFYRQKAGRLFAQIGGHPYPIIIAKPENAMERAEELISRSRLPFDIILFDMPGTINNQGILVTFLSMDYVFTPISPSRMVMESTLPFIVKVKELLREYPKMNLKEIYLFWNRIDSRVKTDIMKMYEEAISSLGIKRLNTITPQSVRFEREQSPTGREPVFLSTFFPPDKSLLKGTNIDLLTDEIIAVIGLKASGHEITGE